MPDRRMHLAATNFYNETGGIDHKRHSPWGSIKQPQKPCGLTGELPLKLPKHRNDFLQEWARNALLSFRGYRAQESLQDKSGRAPRREQRKERKKKREKRPTHQKRGGKSKKRHGDQNVTMPLSKQHINRQRGP
jgi:hypothetical protein